MNPNLILRIGGGDPWRKNVFDFTDAEINLAITEEGLLRSHASGIAGLRLYWTWGDAMTCEEKTRLAGDYDAATTRFSEAVGELRRKMGISPKNEYDRLEWASNEARVKSEQARLALEQHVAAHHC